MRWFSLAACSFCLLIQLISTLPVDNEQSSAVQPQQYLPQQEPLDTLLIAEQDNEQSVRDKRTINVLRQLFPGLAKIIDDKIQMITRLLFRVVGRLVLRGGILGGGGGGGGGGTSSASSASSSGTGNRRISITLPTYPPDAEDEDEENTEYANTVAVNDQS